MYQLRERDNDIETINQPLGILSKIPMSPVTRRRGVRKTAIQLLQSQQIMISANAFDHTHAFQVCVNAIRSERLGRSMQRGFSSQATHVDKF